MLQGVNVAGVERWENSIDALARILLLLVYQNLTSTTSTAATSTTIVPTAIVRTKVESFDS